MAFKTLNQGLSAFEVCVGGLSIHEKLLDNFESCHDSFSCKSI